MKRKLINIAYICLLIASLSSCKKFLDIDTNENSAINPHTVSDFEEILNAPEICQPNYFLADITGDDLTIADNTPKISLLWRAYAWEAELIGPTDDDPVFNDSYKWIMHMNLVIEKIPTAPEGTPERQAVAVAQAKINRAYYYLQLVNIYGPTYNPSTASTDLGVPLVTTVSSLDVHPRTTVKQVYDQILSDLNDAVNTLELPDFGSNIIHPGRAAALGLQARTYLLMGDYPKALQSANATLTIKNNLMDYTNIESKPQQLLDYQSNTETLLARANTMSLTPFGSTFVILLQQDLVNLFDYGDLRYELSTQQHQFLRRNLAPVNQSLRYHFDYSVTVPEVMLIKAECLARADNPIEAINILNEIRKNRFYIEDFEPLNSDVTSEIALQKVLDERRQELFVHGGLRLFDIKRLGLSMKRESMFGMPLSSVAPQPAGSKRFILPFSPKTLALNTKLIQNER